MGVTAKGAAAAAAAAAAGAGDSSRAAGRPEGTEENGDDEMPSKLQPQTRSNIEMSGRARAAKGERSPCSACCECSN